LNASFFFNRPRDRILEEMLYICATFKKNE
jgi:hypothetical protein